VAGTAEAITVTAANLTGPITVTMESVSGPGVSWSPTTVAPAPGELVKLSMATWAAAGTAQVRGTAPGGIVSNTITVPVSPAPAPPPPGPPPPWPPSGNRRIAIGGQSNAQGLGEPSDLNSPPLSADPDLNTRYLADFDRVWIWNPSAGAYQRLRYGTNQQANGTNQIGPEFGIAIRWMRETTGVSLYIDKYAEGGQAIAFFQSPGTFYTNSTTRKSAQDSWLSANSVTATAAGWLWVQGESDSAASESTYRAALDTLVADRISGGLMGAGERRVIAQINATNALYGAGVAAAKTAYAAANSEARLITYANLLNGDNLHLATRGQMQLGYDAISALFDASPLSA
jgi:hypothetical protein